MTTKVTLDQLMNVSEAQQKGLSRLASDAEAGKDTVLMRGGKPVAAIVGLDTYNATSETERRRVDTLLVIQDIVRRAFPGDSLVSLEEALTEPEETTGR